MSEGMSEVPTFRQSSDSWRSCRLRFAGLLALLDRRFNVTVEDWELARIFKATSRAVRTTIVTTVEVDTRKREESFTARVVRREAAVANDARSRATASMAKAIARYVHKHGPATRRAAARSTATGDRANATIDDAIDEAIRLKWITLGGDVIEPGEAKPT